MRKKSFAKLARFYSVLSEIEFILLKVQGAAEVEVEDLISIERERIRVKCLNVIIADRVFQTYAALVNTGYGLTLEVEGHLPSNFPPLFSE